jgi:hypothetical protein
VACCQTWKGSSKKISKKCIFYYAYGKGATNGICQKSYLLSQSDHSALAEINVCRMLLMDSIICPCFGRVMGVWRRREVLSPSLSLPLSVCGKLPRRRMIGFGSASWRPRTRARHELIIGFWGTFTQSDIFAMSCGLKVYLISCALYALSISDFFVPVQTKVDTQNTKPCTMGLLGCHTLRVNGLYRKQGVSSLMTVPA